MRLLIGYDGSESADAALEELRWAGLPAQCEALLLSVVDAWLPPVDDSPPDAALRGARQRLQREILEAIEAARRTAESAAERLRKQFPLWSVRAEACADSPAWAIIRRAEGWEDPWRADLIVLGATGRSTLSRLLLGDVSRKVITYAHCSVRLARRRQPPAGQPLRLVVGTDGSPDAELAVQRLAERTWPAGTQVCVVSVVDSRMLSAVPPFLAPGPASARAVAESVATRAAERLRERGLEAVTRVAEGHARDVLLHVADELSAQCLFVGARGLTRVERILLGSVSFAVALRAGCSVEIVRGPGPGVATGPADGAGGTRSVASRPDADPSPRPDGGFPEGPDRTTQERGPTNR